MLLKSVKGLFFIVLPVFTGLCEGEVSGPWKGPSHSEIPA